ncbi:MAG: response regulator [Betaproteobacteria bacterium]|nr:response regulator [Betaproteobacteria bacterium]
MAVRLSFASDRNPQARGIDRQSALLGRRVLVVDDSASQRRRMSDIYESLGMQVVGEATNGLECLAMVDRLQPDIISLDVIMPVMHGVETLAYLREKKTRSVIVYVSALGAVEAMSDVKSPGGHLPDAVFSKKDTRETFADVLTAVIVGEDDSASQSTRQGSEDQPSATRAG